VSVRGVGWYGGAFVALIASAAALGFFGLSFFSSFTPLYVSIIFSVVAIACGVVAAVLARPAEAARADDNGAPDHHAEQQLDDVDTPPAEHTEQLDDGTDQPDTEAAGVEEERAEQPTEAARPGDGE
jgi:hypothetical protein